MFKKNIVNFLHDSKFYHKILLLMHMQLYVAAESVNDDYPFLIIRKYGSTFYIGIAMVV